MSDEIRVNRPQAQTRPEGGMPSYASAETGAQSKLPWVILGLVVVVLIVVGVLFRDKLFSSGSMKPAGTSNTTSSANSTGYQAVFLTNGQVYFGKVSDLDKEFLVVKDIYYLQVIQKQPLQGTPQQAGQPAAQPQQEISLVKLGNELHGPVDEMHINRAQVLFYEDLKADGSVVKAITDDKAKQAAPAK